MPGNKARSTVADRDPTRSPSRAPLDVWNALNDRQRATLIAIFELDQDIERSRRIEAARGVFDRRPAAEWRAIDFSEESMGPTSPPKTCLQEKLDAQGWHSQGNGSTMVALAARGLIYRNIRGTSFGATMHTVRLTRDGRAAARVATTLATGTASKPGLSARSWEVLAKLWMVDVNDDRLAWGRSTTIDNVLIGKHIPPLAQRAERGGYEITERGRDFYRQQYAVHVAAYPDVRAPHPDGPDAEPWPAKTDRILDAHSSVYRALTAAWRTACTMQQQAEQEAAAPPAPADNLPPALAAQITARHDLWQATARQRAELAAEHVTDLQQRAARAARAYATATLTALHAAVAGTNPLTGLTGPEDDDAWDEPPLRPPAETGIHAIDAEAKTLHATAVGKPPRRRGPAPKIRKRSYAQEPTVPPPGADLAALADFLRGHTRGGVLLRRLHP